jgi:tRNA pseudouridine55 synthase
VTGLDGLLLVDKPGGITSHDAVDLVRRSLATKKVGHAGTLDPMATGLLVLGVGRGTRLLRFFGELTKMYEGTMTLGIETDTLDADGVVTRESTLEGVTEDRVREACEALVGVSMQRPPAYSAVKVGGRTSYEAARRGEVLDTPAREIRVERFDVVAYEPPSVGFVVACGGGTYVRALAADVGGSLGVGAHLSRLRRTSIGPFSVGDAVPPDDPGRPLSLERGLAHLPHLDLEADEAVAVSHGRILGPAGIDGPYAVFSPEGRVLGVYRDEGTKARPEVILAPA